MTKIHFQTHFNELLMIRVIDQSITVVRSLVYLSNWLPDWLIACLTNWSIIVGRFTCVDHPGDNHRTVCLFPVSYEDTELLFQWKKEKGNKEVVVSDDLEIPQFILTKYWTEASLANFTSGRLASQLWRDKINQSILKIQYRCFIRV